MLVLERAEGKKIIIGKNIVLTLQEIKTECVLISVDSLQPQNQTNSRSSSKTSKDSSTRQTTTLARNESLNIAQNIKVAFIRSRGSDAALIGIEAPRSIPVWREELLNPSRNSQ